MRGFFGLIAVVLCLFLLLPGGIRAQESGTIQAIATVVASLQVIGMNNLNFGSVTPGINKSVSRVDVGFAGEWQVNGSPSSQLSIDFTLPTVLYTADSSSTLMIQFNNTDASYDDGTGGGQTIPLGTVDPNGPSVLNLGVGGSLWFWIGGTVLPTISQTGGDYAADIILTVAYTGS
jgi:hypothetical protein